MSLKRYLITMGIATAVALVSWSLVLIFFDPASGAIGRTLFFMSFFLSMFGILSVVGFFLRKVIQRSEAAFRLVAISFRQGALFALLLTSSMILLSQRLFTWWTSSLLLIFVTLLEAFFVARETNRSRHSGRSHGT